MMFNEGAQLATAVFSGTLIWSSNRAAKMSGHVVWWRSVVDKDYEIRDCAIIIWSGGGF